MKSWVLFFLGTLAYFLSRYINRRKKNIDFDFNFWLKDNWPELTFAFIIDLAMVLIALDPDTNIDITGISWIPEWLTFPVKLLVSFGIGFGGGAGVYAAFRNKTNKALKDFSRGAIDAEEVRRDKDNA